MPDQHHGFSASSSSQSLSLSLARSSPAHAGSAHAGSGSSNSSGGAHSILGELKAGSGVLERTPLKRGSSGSGLTSLNSPAGGGGSSSSNSAAAGSTTARPAAPVYQTPLQRIARLATTPSSAGSHPLSALSSPLPNASTRTLSSEHAMDLSPLEQSTQPTTPAKSSPPSFDGTIQQAAPNAPAHSSAAPALSPVAASFPASSSAMMSDS